VLIFTPVNSVVPERITESCKVAAKVLLKEHGLTATLISTVIGKPVIAKRVASGVPVDQVFSCKETVHPHAPFHKLNTYKIAYAGDKLPVDGCFVEIHGATLRSQADYASLHFVALNTDFPIYFIRSKTIPKIDQSKCIPLGTYVASQKDSWKLDWENQVRHNRLVDALHKLSGLRILRNSTLMMDGPRFDRLDKMRLKFAKLYVDYRKVLGPTLQDETAVSQSAGVSRISKEAEEMWNTYQPIINAFRYSYADRDKKEMIKSLEYLVTKLASQFINQAQP
jgi:hypothetical protein